MCTFDRVGHSRHHSAPLLAAQPSKQKEPGIVVLLISSTHHDYLTRTSSDNPQTPLYYHLIEKCITICFIDHKNDDNLLCSLGQNCSKTMLVYIQPFASECFHLRVYDQFRGTHLDTRVFTCYRLRDERHFTQWYAIISFALHGKQFYLKKFKPKTFLSLVFLKKVYSTQCFSAKDFRKQWPSSSKPI